YRQKYRLLKVLPIKTILRLIKAGPTVLHLLISLLNHEQVSRRTKRMVAAALGYFIFPLDVLPEAIIGPLGYVDDIVVGLMLVDHLLNGENEEEKELIATLWQGTPEELATLRTLLKGVDFSRYIGRVLRKIIPMKR
ncbi:MAG TPA: DUF1232 domain-containing protein, partial [bacterium]|nr:DUF1232 domain-containing protein [bacterium]